MKKKGIKYVVIVKHRTIIHMWVCWQLIILNCLIASHWECVWVGLGGCVCVCVWHWEAGNIKKSLTITYVWANKINSSKYIYYYYSYLYSIIDKHRVLKRNSKKNDSYVFEFKKELC